MEMYEEFLYPFQKTVADAISKPWALHSDGNLFPILDGLLKLGMNAIHPIQPSAMDIGKMKAQYGSRVCLIGNIDLDYTLTLGTPEEVDAEEVKQRIGGRSRRRSCHSSAVEQPHRLLQDRECPGHGRSGQKYARKY